MITKISSTSTQIKRTHSHNGSDSNGSSEYFIFKRFKKRFLLIFCLQVFFLLAQVTGLICALLYRYWDDLNRPIELGKPNSDRLSKAAEKRNLALLLMTIPGIGIVYLCYGR